MALSQWLVNLLPTLTAGMGFAAGLMAPVVTDRLTRRSKRRDDQRARCGEILAMFRDVNVVRALTDPGSTTRRNLLLVAACLHDDNARHACNDLVAFASEPEADSAGVLDRWTAMVQEVSRAYRAVP
jgi:hypothetical protein